MSFASEPEPVKNTWLKRRPAYGRDLLGQQGRRRRGRAEEGVVIGQLVHLPCDGIGDLLAAIADIDAPEAGEAIEIFLAVVVEDVDALAALDDARSLGIQLLHVGEGMQVMGGVDRGQVRQRVSIGHD